MTQEVRIISAAFTDSTSKRILCTNVTYGLKKNTQKKPNANVGELVEVQTQAFENPVINVQGVRFTNEANTLTFKNVQELIKDNYGGSNAPTLSVTYADYDLVTEQSLTSLADLATTQIPVILESHTFNISVSDSKEGHLPIGNLIFLETA